MTPLTKRVTRRTLGEHRKRRIAVSLLPGDILGFRFERTHRTWYTTIAAGMDLAIRNTINAEQRAKKQSRQKK